MQPYAESGAPVIKWNAVGVLADSGSPSKGSDPATMVGSGQPSGQLRANEDSRVTFVLSTDDVDRHGT